MKFCLICDQKKNSKIDICSTCKRDLEIIDNKTILQKRGLINKKISDMGFDMSRINISILGNDQK